ncbi:DEAD/DEAH box helicase [Candidatus Woesearchaeota archaeon]|nr:DEAD/DEAH box helicase [Candidatus Woesearchaeota archaeon]
MEFSRIKDYIPREVYEVLENSGIRTLRPCQEKAIGAGLLQGKNILVCTPTASGKTLVAELAALHAIQHQKGKAVYIVPLKSLASEKHKEFKKKYGHLAKIALSIGDLDTADPYLHTYDLIICTSEKLDSLIRHHTPWLKEVACVIVDEIHLLNDASRGPTLEIILTILKKIVPCAQIVGLSATIGNEQELAQWLGAHLVHDTWRPVELHKGVYCEGKIDFVNECEK